MNPTLTRSGSSQLVGMVMNDDAPDAPAAAELTAAELQQIEVYDDLQLIEAARECDCGRGADCEVCYDGHAVEDS